MMRLTHLCILRYTHKICMHIFDMHAATKAASAEMAQIIVIAGSYNSFGILNTH